MSSVREASSVCLTDNLTQFSRSRSTAQSVPLIYHNTFSIQNASTQQFHVLFESVRLLQIQPNPAQFWNKAKICQTIKELYEITNLQSFTQQQKILEQYDSKCWFYEARIIKKILQGKDHDQYIELLPLRIDTGNRMFRQFGSHRFLNISIPKIRVLGELRHFLKIEILGRIYKLIWISFSDDNCTMILFAESGFDIENPIKISQVLDWHLQPYNNQHMLAMKLFCRLSMGFSDTIPLDITDSLISEIPDVYNDGELMTDGCGFMSDRIASLVSQKMSAIQDCNITIPSVVQFRYGPYKGLLERKVGIESDLQLREFSQCKYSLKHEEDPLWSFEIVNVSRPRQSSRLNRQFINVLAANGVSLETFIHHFDLQIAQDVKDIFTKYRKRDYTIPISNYMNARDSGISIENEPYWRMKAQAKLRREYQSIIEKFHIRVEASTTVYMIPDSTGTLGPHECYIRLSNRPSPVFGTELIVLRNPCLHRGNILKLENVFHQELSILENVIVLSTADSLCPASVIGGDYDGDRVFVCWDQSIVNQVKLDKANYEISNSYNDELYDVNKATVKDYIDQYGDDAYEGMLFDLLKRSCQLQLGKVELLHSLTCDQRELDHPDCIFLADLFDNLLIGKKMGVLPIQRVIEDLNIKLKERSSPHWSLRSSRCEDEEYVYRSLSLLGQLYTYMEESVKGVKISGSDCIKDDDLCAPFDDAQLISAFNDDDYRHEELQKLYKKMCLLRDEYDMAITAQKIQQEVYRETLGRRLQVFDLQERFRSKLVSSVEAFGAEIVASCAYICTREKQIEKGSNAIGRFCWDCLTPFLCRIKSDYSYRRITGSFDIFTVSPSCPWICKDH